MSYVMYEVNYNGQTSHDIMSNYYFYCCI